MQSGTLRKGDQGIGTALSFRYLAIELGTLNDPIGAETE